MLSHEIDPDSLSFIRTICNQTRNRDTCESIFTQNLPDPEADPLTLTRVAIDITLKVLYDDIVYFRSEKQKIKNLLDEAKNKLDLLEICDKSYAALKIGVEELKKGIDIENIRSMAKVGQSFGKLQGLADYEMVKCENMVENINGFDVAEDLSLMQIIVEKNKEVGLLIEIVVSSGKNLVKVMDIGAEEAPVRHNSCSPLVAFPSQWILSTRHMLLDEILSSRLDSLFSLIVNSRKSVAKLMDEIHHLRQKKDELIETMNKKRETFAVSCTQFQTCIEGDECNELRALLFEKESLEDEIRELDQTLCDLKNSVSAQSMKILEDLYRSNSGLEAEIQKGNAENEQLTKEIDDLRTNLLSTIDDPW
ncbi:hypothetical protein KSS87_011369 [Heliosperma pusillum]|nr:hypothetical protein KSS87_011369 [Heliosperma pusillum]